MAALVIAMEARALPARFSCLESRLPSLVCLVFLYLLDRIGHEVVHLKMCQSDLFPVCFVSSLLASICFQALCFRWSSVLKVSNRRTGKWGGDEDAALLAAVEKYGKNWAMVEKEVPFRTQVRAQTIIQ